MGIGPTEGARDLLAAERASTQARLAALEREFDGIVESSAGAATDDEHDPEGGTTAFERQHLAALIGQARDRLADIAKALDRLDAGSYGQCERCGRPIATERLAARPTATTCISCAAAHRH
jgi:RNA polymerase-binding transcription factor DksA